ncbi:MAG TPA: hypothetical protein VJZ27_02910 [Aggregatilineales bacterium]|nr:hypothetical protein [Aggregatilineales bacterium]
MSAIETFEIGRVLRASTEGFTCGTRSQEILHPTFGAFVQTTHEDGELVVVGVITAIRIDDDPLVRQLIMAGNMDATTLRDQRENRLVPVEIEVLNIGYVQDDLPFYNLPPRPPLSLDPVNLLSTPNVEYFTQHLHFLRLILTGNNGFSTPDLLGAVVRKAAGARPAAEQRAYLIDAGRYLAGLLSHDMAMLRYVLDMLRPVT